jgi:aerobic carbon-monoxide dehydrogenase small subunit
MASKIITFTLNSRETEVMVKPLTTLQTLLREKLGLTAAKSGCKQGGCGSCTVLVNGEPMLSCLLPVEDIEGQSVTTLEGITPTDGLHPLQSAFFENYAIQCGYCTPGMLMVAKALLDRNPHPTRDEVVEALSGNLCRCTGYEPILQAIDDVAVYSAAAQRMDGREKGA